MIIVTGGAGFIGSNIVRRLNGAGRTDIIVVDDMTDGRKAFNLADCVISDYIDVEEFFGLLKSGRGLPDGIDAISHQGACTTTTEWDGQYMMHVNYEFSRDLAAWCIGSQIPLVYASSASVYGCGTESQIAPEFERPINVYAWSKLVFDQHVRQIISTAKSQVAGLRYFNVFGPRETHKGKMASVIYHFSEQLLAGNEVCLFAGSDGYDDGEQRRDFIHVDDIVDMNMWFLEHPDVSGIYNAGTGKSRSFNDVARAVIDWHGHGEIRYIPFPDQLVGSYQSFTEADIDSLRIAGYDRDFLSVEEGVRRYLDVLRGNQE